MGDRLLRRGARLLACLPKSTRIGQGIPHGWDVAGFAEVFVASFVAAGEGTESSLTPFLGEAPPAMGGVVAGEWFAARTTAMSVERLDR